MILAVEEVAKNEELANFVKGEIKKIQDKKANAKPTKTQIENEKYKKMILDILANVGKALTIAEIQAENNELAGLKNQKISAIITQLRKAELITREEIKKKAYFKIAE